MMRAVVTHPEGARVQSAASWPVTGRPDWRERLPVLCGERIVLRELLPADGPPLAALLTTDEVTRFISPPPKSAEAFDRCIQNAVEQRAAGMAAWYAVTPRAFDTPVGLFQVRSIEPGFATAEWGFALGSGFWGTGIFDESAALVLAFSFETLGVHRLEARVAVRNGRGIGALRKLGAVQEGLLRKSLLCNGAFLDQALYTILDDDWRRAQAMAGSRRVTLAVH